MDFYVGPIEKINQAPYLGALKKRALHNRGRASPCPPSWLKEQKTHNACKRTGAIRVKPLRQNLRSGLDANFLVGEFPRRFFFPATVVTKAVEKDLDTVCIKL